MLNADGVDMSSVRHGLAEDCFIYCADDAVVVKSYGEHKSSDILARRNVILTKKSALKVGTESEADMDDITFIDNEVVESDRGMTLYVEDGVTVRDVRYINNCFEYHIPDARQRLIDFYIWDRRGGGNVINVLVKDCEADMRWPRPSTIAGLDENNEFKGVHFENFRLEGRVAKTLAEADVVVEVYSPQDVRRPHVHDVTVDGETWNPGLLVEREARPCR